MLKPRYGPSAAPSPSPPGRKAGNEVESPAVFRIAAGRARLRHPWPAPVGDLDPDNVVRRLDRDGYRLAREHPSRYAAGYWRKARPPAMPPRPRTGARGLAPPRRTNGRPVPAPPVPQASRSPGPPAQPSAHPPSRPPSSPGNRAGRRADTCGCTLDSAANVKARQPPERAPEPRQAATHTAPWPRFPSAMRPWTPQHNAPTATQGDT